MHIFPNITRRDVEGGQPKTVLRGTAIRVQTIVIAAHQWGLEPEQLAYEYDISVANVHEVLAFYATHQCEIDAAVAFEEMLENGSIGRC